jgi:hypothetical protein
MSAAPKYKHQFKNDTEQTQQDKREIDAYQKKIAELLNDPQGAKKAAQIIEELINSGPKNK